jgi:hypothetical protein
METVTWQVRRPPETEVRWSGVVAHYLAADPS